VINLRFYIKWNFKDKDRPLDRFRITKPEVKVGCAYGEGRQGLLWWKNCWKSSIWKDKKKMRQ
jgi:hypothetical protein